MLHGSSVGQPLRLIDYSANICIDIIGGSIVNMYSDRAMRTVATEYVSSVHLSKIKSSKLLNYMY